MSIILNINLNYMTGVVRAAQEAGLPLPHCKLWFGPPPRRVICSTLNAHFELRLGLPV